MKFYLNLWLCPFKNLFQNLKNHTVPEKFKFVQKTSDIVQNQRKTNFACVYTRKVFKDFLLKH
jgi:hypothetical protein